MFDFFRRHTRTLQFLLVLLVFPSFVFFGIQGYSRFAGNDQQTVAKVAGQPVTQAEFDAALRERVDRARRQMPSLDPKMFESPEMRSLALDGLIRDRVTLVAADKLHLAMTDDRLERAFKGDPEYASLRNPDGSINRDTLTALGMSSEQFAERLRQDLSRRQVMQPLGTSAIAPAAAASAALEAMYQQREVQVERFDAKDQLAKVKPSDAEVEAYYKDPLHAAQFQAPEQATIEYVTLDLDSVKKNIAVSEDDLRKYYAENEKRYTAPEERRASHILVKADKDAPKAERDKARAKAEGLLAEVRKNPQSFAEIARRNSDDEGSAAKGGDLDFFGRGAMVKPFEDAAFGMKPGETSGIVESEFGYHIIQVTGARGGDKKSFDSVRAAIETEVKNQLAQKKFADAAVEFGDTVYEQADSLKPAADKWKLEIRTAKNVTRMPAPGASGALANPRFLEALFASDVTRDKRNTKAIDVGSNQLAAGRVVQYAPAHQLPFAEVKDRVRQQLAATQAAALATKLGSERLDKARAAPTEAFTGETIVVSRAQPRDLPRPLLDAILKAPLPKLPAFVGVPLGDQGFAVVKIAKTVGRDPVVADPAKAMAQYAQVWAEAEAQAYYAALKSRFKVSVNEAAATAPRDAASEPR
ncbi:MAG TPA: SurA N-terminal domain-containing protein [Caldimonas sp.]|jgi:peptidyl-prolyl cis-trans isomerase D|nr:SurA N-terminal domain-containing protein [Caldimonas sp.]